MNYTELIKPELLTLIPVLYLLGIAMKQSLLIADSHIPLFNGLISILLCTLYLLATCSFSTAGEVFLLLFTGITQGILCAGASVYANQLVKQIKKED